MITKATMTPGVPLKGVACGPGVSATPRFQAGNLAADQFTEPSLALKPNPSRTVLNIGSLLNREFLIRGQYNIPYWDIHGIDTLKRLLKEKVHLIIAPNHPGSGDVYFVPELARRTKTPVSVMVTQSVFSLETPKVPQWLSRLGGWLPAGLKNTLKKQAQSAFEWFKRFRLNTFSKMGLFPIHHDNAASPAGTTAIRQVVDGTYPLVIFPEGRLTYQSRKVLEGHPGTVSIAMMAAKMVAPKGKKIAILPVGMTYQYLHNPQSTLERAMKRLEKELRLFTPPRYFLNTHDRLDAIYAAVLQTKAHQALGQAPSADNVVDLHAQVLEALMDPIEHELKLTKTKSMPYFERIQTIRQLMYTRYNDSKPPMAPETKEKYVRNYIPKLRLAYDLQRLSPDYHRRHPSWESIAETLHQLETIVTGKSKLIQSVPRKMIIHIGDPIMMDEHALHAAKDRAIREPWVTKTNAALQSQLQSLVDRGHGVKEKVPVPL